MSDKDKQILRAAEQLFAGGRYHEITLDDICKKAGVGKGTIYRYFEDKEDLLRQVILSGLDELVESVEEVGRREQDPGKGLRLLVRTIADFFTARAALFGLVWRGRLRGPGRRKSIRKEWRRRDEKMLRVVSAYVVRGTEDGRYDGRFTPAATARLLLGAIRTGLMNRDEMPGGKDWAIALVELLENGLLVRNA